MKDHFNVNLGITIPDLKLYYRNALSSQNGNGISADMETNGAEDTETNTCRHSHLITERGVNNLCWTKVIFLSGVAGKTG